MDGSALAPLSLLQPTRVGPFALRNRVVMGPMTRNRAEADGTPTAIMAEYYRQRAGAGLIVTEGAQVSEQGRGYAGTPGLHTPGHSVGWRAVTDAVHAEGGVIFAQLWHVGRVSHSSLQPGGGLPIGPSALPAEGRLYTPAGAVDFEAPRPLATDEIAAVVAEFRASAEVALEAGFDGVEIQAANGYLIDQFLRDGSNRRDDVYGGSADNRVRLLLEVVDAVAEVFDAERVAVRLSPTHPWNGMADSDPQALFETAVERLAPYGLAYLHLVQNDAAFDWARLRDRFTGPVVLAGGYDRASAEAAVLAGDADLVAFGTPFIANPDLVTRLLHGHPLAAPDKATFYSGGARGYVDYPPFG